MFWQAANSRCPCPRPGRLLRRSEISLLGSLPAACWQRTGDDPLLELFQVGDLLAEVSVAIARVKATGQVVELSEQPLGKVGDLTAAFVLAQGHRRGQA